MVHLVGGIDVKCRDDKEKKNTHTDFVEIKPCVDQSLRQQTAPCEKA